MARESGDRLSEQLDALDSKLDDLALTQAGHFQQLREQTSKATEAGESRATNLLRTFAVIHGLLITIYAAVTYIRLMLESSGR